MYALVKAEGPSFITGSLMALLTVTAICLLTLAL